MFGLIGKIEAKPDKGRELAEVLAAGSREMPGNQAYIVALDQENHDLVWITEVWDSPESHQASLQLESVQAAIAKGRPLIKDFTSRTEVIPI